MNKHILRSFLRRHLAVVIGVSMLSLPAFAAAQSLLTRELDVGSQGDDVTLLQQFLALKGAIYPEALITGYYGTLTQNAVDRYQQSVGLPAVGRVGPLTMSSINSLLGATGGSDDVTAPVLGQEYVSTTQNSATFTWLTDEFATSRVMYAGTKPFMYESANQATGAMGTSHLVTITGLLPGHVYYYTVESDDQSGNVSMTLQKPFMTQP